MFYAGNTKYLVAFNERNARDKFVDDHPSYYSVYAKDARTYPQFNMVRSHPRGVVLSPDGVINMYWTNLVYESMSEGIGIFLP